jgi:hypothetical protein
MDAFRTPTHPQAIAIIKAAKGWHTWGAHLMRKHMNKRGFNTSERLLAYTVVRWEIEQRNMTKFLAEHAEWHYRMTEGRY